MLQFPTASNTIALPFLLLPSPLTCLSFICLVPILIIVLPLPRLNSFFDQSSRQTIYLLKLRSVSKSHCFGFNRVLRRTNVGFVLLHTN